MSIQYHPCLWKSWTSVLTLSWVGLALQLGRNHSAGTASYRAICVSCKRALLAPGIQGPKHTAQIIPLTPCSKPTPSIQGPNYCWLQPHLGVCISEMQKFYLAAELA